jgi:DNA polymerase-4
MAVPARIACLDLDTFFVSVERLYEPSLVGKPVVVGATGWRGVVTSASYEVRALGVRSGMSIVEARRLAPDAIYVAPRHGVYGHFAEQVKEILEIWAPVVQTASIDEFFLDFNGCDAIYAQPGDTSGDVGIARAAWQMREQIQRDVGLPASCGIGSTRPIAKMASGLAKPAGVKLVPPGGERAFVQDLPVRKFPGIGPVAEQRLVESGVATLGQLLDRDGERAESVFHAVYPSEKTTLGMDRPAFHELDDEGRTDGSISNERTFHADVGEDDVIRDQLRGLAERVAWRARRRGVLARTIGLKLRYSDFDTITRHRTGPPTNREADVFAMVLDLYRKAKTRPLPIRLLGVQVSNLVSQPIQLGLPFDERPQAAAAIDAVRERFGFDAIRLGVARSRTS